MSFDERGVYVQNRRPGQAVVSTAEDQALNPVTGEVMDLRSFPSIGLAQQMIAVAENRERLKNYEAAISDELIRRMDQAASWTMREGDYEVTTSSPTAGTIEYVPDALEEALVTLNEANKITTGAAEQALRRTIHFAVEVPFGTDHRKMAMAMLEEWRDQPPYFVWRDGETIEKTTVRITAAAHQTKPSLTGIKALEKLPGVKETLDGAAVAVKPPRRRVSVKRKP